MRVPRLFDFSALLVVSSTQTRNRGPVRRGAPGLWVGVWLCVLAIGLPVWAQPGADIGQAPPDLGQIPIREQGRVTQSPPVMGSLEPAQLPAPQEAAVQVDPHPVSPTPGEISAGQPEGLTVAAGVQRPHHVIPAKYDVTKIGDRNVGHGLDFFSLENEQRLGKDLAQQVEQSARLVTDPVITEYVNRVGQNLVRNSDAKVPFTIKVIDNDEVNAFALPGGYFYVNTGLILASENEAELAGVMAHEIAHVAARHATKNATRQQLFNLASIPLVFFGGPAGMAVRQFVALAVPLSYLKFSRNAEREADMLGLQYQYAAGYDPEEFVRFFEKLQTEKKRKHNFLARAFMTHPMTSDRIKRAQAEIASYLPARNQYIVDTSDFEMVKARLRKMENAKRLSVSERGKPTLQRRESKDEGAPRLERK